MSVQDNPSPLCMLRSLGIALDKTAVMAASLVQLPILHHFTLYYFAIYQTLLRAVSAHADDPQADKLLLVMEYAEAGPVMRGDRSTEKVPLAEGVALKFFRDVLQARRLPGHLHLCGTCHVHCQA